MSYELKIGIETHFELLTDSKLFCGCSTKFGASANTHCCPVCLGLPGALPVINKKAVELAIRAGLATYCNINKNSWMDRKNYFYSDLPKGYQITQYFSPVCQGGYVTLSDNKKIRIDRIQIEEDAGKLIYKDNDILIDYNRSGVPLIEIVSMPDMTTVEQAHEYIEKLVDIMRYIGVSDCKMQEGSVRCDVNISVKKRNSQKDGTKIEIKNLNSIKFIIKAIKYEMNRQISILESGSKVIKETRKYNESTKMTESMRLKESDCDYRYFKEPDLISLNIDNQEIDNIRFNMPEDFDTRLKRYVTDFELNEMDAKNLLKYKKVADYFDEASIGILNKKIVSNIILSQIFSTLQTQEEKENFNVNISSKDLNYLCSMIEENKIEYNLAKKIIQQVLYTNKDLLEVISEINSNCMDDSNLINLCKKVLLQNKNAVTDFYNGKNQALQYLMGQVMKQTTSYVDAKKTANILNEQLNLLYNNK